MKIGHKKIGIGNPTYIIAEAGINHNGDLNLAKKMIDEAANCGVDAIKFQSFSADELFSKKLNPDFFKFAKDLSINSNQHQQLKKYSQKRKIEFISTATGLKSLNLLKKLGVDTIKIASMDTNNHEILKAAARTKVPLIVSTGMSTISEITSAVKTLTKENAIFCLLHCVSSYPTSVCDANLATISYFNKIFDVPIGYSDHTMGIDACITSIPLGSCIIEKHFTLNKKMDGPDHKLSANPKELTKLVKKIRITEKLLGKPRKQILKSEQKFRIAMKRSVGFNQDLRKGTKIKQSMLTFYRPGDGIQPNTINNIIGRKLKQNVTKGTFVNWNMFQPVP